MGNQGNVSVDGCSLLQNSIIAAGRVTLSTGGGTHALTIAGVKATDICICSLESDDTGTSITHLEATCTKDTVTFIRTDDGSSADDGVASYIILRLFADR